MGEEYIDYAREGADLPSLVLDTPAVELRTARLQTRIQAKWIPPKRLTYRVPGNTADEMCSFYRDKVQRNEEWALFKFCISWKPLHERGEDIVSAIFIAQSSITMPRWRALHSQSVEVRTDWNRMYANLLRHERRHVQKYRAKFNADIRLLRRKASRTGRYFTGTDLEDERIAITDACQLVTDQYDAASQNGVLEGVELLTCVFG